MPLASWKDYLRLSMVSCLIYLSPATARTKPIGPRRQPAASLVPDDGVKPPVAAADAEIWVYTCWANPNQQRGLGDPTYERALPIVGRPKSTASSSNAPGPRQGLAALREYKTDTKIGIGIVNHCITTVEPAERVAGLIRKALEYIPPEQRVITTDCGLGREGGGR